MSSDLMTLGYTMHLSQCMVALKLNGDDPQVAALWLLDSSHHYLESHPGLAFEEDVVGCLVTCRHFHMLEMRITIVMIVMPYVKQKGRDSIR